MMKYSECMFKAHRKKIDTCKISSWYKEFKSITMKRYTFIIGILYLKYYQAHDVSLA